MTVELNGLDIGMSNRICGLTMSYVGHYYSLWLIQWRLQGTVRIVHSVWNTTIFTHSPSPFYFYNLMKIMFDKSENMDCVYCVIHHVYGSATANYTPPQKSCTLLLKWHTNIVSNTYNQQLQLLWGQTGWFPCANKERLSSELRRITLQNHRRFKCEAVSVHIPWIRSSWDVIAELSNCKQLTFTE